MSMPPDAAMLPADRRLAGTAQRVAMRLLAAGSCLATAESCTGGWVAKCCTDIPGSSRWFERGLVTYSDVAKQELLGVKAATLARHGAVSEAVAVEMVRGLLHRSRADVGVAVTGIAGPDGGSPGKPVGTVWFAWGRRIGRRIVVRTERRRFRGDREQVRRRSVLRALSGVLEQLEP